jgi:hypothetical protein
MALPWQLTLHWSAGGYHPDAASSRAYHFLVDNLGHVFSGKYMPDDNVPPLSGGYAAHTHHRNSYNIGVCLLGMAGFDLARKQTRYPLTRIQCERACALCASLARQYDIPLEAIRTHYEIGLEDARLKRHNSLNIGKIDITWLPFQPNLLPEHVGDAIRRKIGWYIKHMAPNPTPDTP